MKLIISILLTSFTVSANDLDNFNGNQLLQQYEEVTKHIKSVFSQESKCTEFKDNDEDFKICSFKNFCQMFQQNSEKPYIYEGNDGRIPNFNLLTLESQVNQCYSTAKFNSSNTSGAGSFGDSEAFTKWKKKKFEAKKAC